MTVQVVRPTDTPEIRWPVLPDSRTDEPALEDTRQPTRRHSRENRVTRLRWGLAWLALVFGAISAWLWLARQDEIAAKRLVAIKELRELAGMRVDLEHAEDLRPPNLRLYVQQATAKHAVLREQMESLSGDSALTQAWTTEQSALQEAKGDLEWLEPRLRQLDLIQGAKLTDEIKANEASLRPVLDRFSAQDSCPGARFRPALARSLLTELNRRIKEVQLASAPPAPTMLAPEQFTPPHAPQVKRGKLLKPALKQRVRPAAGKSKVRARTRPPRARR